MEGAIAQLLLGLPSQVFAQSITIDGTLHPTRTLTGANYRIRQADGRTVGRNLFHSFGRFNLNTGESATFESTPDIRNIITRVTGGSPSAIDGLIQTESNNVNLFLINPNGIMFGRNASLNIGGSFVASTANSFRFANGNEFSAIQPQAPSLLMIDVPIGLQYGRQTGAITSQADLSVSSGRSLVLAGGAIDLTNSNLEVNFPQGGRIELGSVGDAGTIGLNHQGNLLSLNFPTNLERANISLRNSALDATATDGGEISLTGRSIHILDESQILAGIAAGYGSANSQAGNIRLDAVRTIKMGQSSLIANMVAVTPERQLADLGNAGNIYILAGSLSVTGNAQLSASTSGRGDAGSVIIEARDRVEFEGIGSAALSRSGNISPNGQVISVGGRGGDVRISTGTLAVRNGAQLSTSTFARENAGSVIIEARDRVEFEGIGSVAFSRSGGIASSGKVLDSSGRGGDVRISTGTLTVRNGAQLDASTFSRGDAGSVIIEARDRVEFEGNESAASSSSGGIYRNRQVINAIGRGGDVHISTGTLAVRNGAQLSAITFGRGDAGSVIIETRDQVKFEGSNTGASSSSGAILNSGRVINARGRGGDVSIFTNTLSVIDGAQLNAESAGGGSAGNILINANVITLDRGGITTETRSRNGGNITLQNADLLLLLQNSRISTSAGIAQAGGNGGNITLNANLIAASVNANNDITANAFSGQGGAVNITGQLAGLDLLNRDELQARLGTTNDQKIDPSRLPTNDITAISQTAPTLNGQVTLNPSNVDPSRGLVELPTSVVDRSTQIVRGCTPRGQESGRFVVTGRGGLPLSPDEALRDRTILSPGWVTLNSEAEDGTVGKLRSEGEQASPENITPENITPENTTPENTTPENTTPENTTPENTIVEADGLGRDAKGKVILVTRSQAASVFSQALQVSCVNP